MLHEVDEGVTINKNVKERETKMGKIGFDNEKYLNMQSEHIRERMAQFGGKLYMEFGGKLFDDYHDPEFFRDSSRTVSCRCF